MTRAPSVLIDASGGEAARLYERPRAIISAGQRGEVRQALADMRAALAGGAHLAGFLSYECGVAMQPKDLPIAASPLPLLWFGVFDAPTRMEEAAVRAWLPDTAGASVGPPRPRITQDEYEHAFARVHDWIRAGDIYQANLTFRADVPVAGDPRALYAMLRGRARAGHAAFVDIGEDTILSLSPELFFHCNGDALTTRPMKGTAPRRSDPDADRREAEALASDPKQRAENLMIVDLLRNDLSRVARVGSVKVPRMFEVETYPSVHQMTSTVRAALCEGCDTIDVLEAAFPCGSITGAPKVRAMEIIAQVESEARGIYCGSIGWMDPGGDAAFNVAIRTLHIAGGAREATLGLGSAIVADSVAASEWQECLTKALFLSVEADTEMGHRSSIGGP